MKIHEFWWIDRFHMFFLCILIRNMKVISFSQYDFFHHFGSSGVHGRNSDGRRASKARKIRRRCNSETAARKGLQTETYVQEWPRPVRSAERNAAAAWLVLTTKAKTARALFFALSGAGTLGRECEWERAADPGLLSCVDIGFQKGNRRSPSCADVARRGRKLGTGTA